VQELLGQEEGSWLLRQRHRPCAAAGVMSTVLRRARIDSIQRSLLDQQLGELINVLGGCERIIKTPIPAAYSRCVRLARSVRCAAAVYLNSRRSRRCAR
jgi:predicted membrane chloride channel (bestrophin family)